jgi:hypothetical protein
MPLRATTGDYKRFLAARAEEGLQPLPAESARADHRFRAAPGRKTAARGPLNRFADDGSIRNGLPLVRVPHYREYRPAVDGP